MKHKLLCAAAALALTAGSASAQYAPPPAPDVLPPHEIVTIVRSTGLNPLERPVRRGNTYVFRAMGAGGQEMRVTVDARYGDVMSVSPVANVARPGALPGPGLSPGMTLGPYERVDRDDDDAGPQRLSPPGIYGSRPPPIGEVDDDDEPVIYAPGARPQAPGTVRPPAPVTSAPLAPPPGGQQPFITQQRMQTSAPPPPSASIAPPPAPMPSTASVGEPQQITQPGEGGLLPPPPERFPQRVLPPATAAKPAAAKPAPKPAQQKPAAAQPKPAQQQKTAASSAAPAKPPLPKSKPASPAAAPATPSAAPAAPAKKPAGDDVPH